MVPESLCAFLKELIRVWKRVEVTMGYESSVEAAMCKALSGGEYDGVCAAHSPVEMFVHKLSVLYLEHWSFWLWLAFVSIALGGFLIRRSKAAVLLLDFECFNPPDKLKVSREWLVYLATQSGVFSEESIRFMEKVGKLSGISEITSIPEPCIRNLKLINEFSDWERKRGVPLEGRHSEADQVAFATIQDLLDKTGVKPSEIGMVITACDCFAPQPSMSARIVNHFKIPHTVLSYSMTGMGCSNGGICIDMAKYLLKSNPETLCLIFNHENMSAGGYMGNDRTMLLPYCLFRVSGAAAFLTNRKCDHQRAKYELALSIRTHIGSDDAAHTCIQDAVDKEGLPGIRINKSVVPSATKALKLALQVLGPEVLPVTEMVKVKLYKDYVPDFKKSFEHFLIQTGGKAVLDAMEKAFGLPAHQMQASRDSLLRFANTAGASNWYTLLALESRTGVKKGDRILGMMFGAGFKAVSVVWRARRDIKDIHPLWTTTHPEQQVPYEDIGKEHSKLVSAGNVER